MEEEEEEEDYFAPFGMSQFDFNSMIRRRNLGNLTQQLVEQGRVTLPGASAVPPSNNTAQLVDVENGVANTSEPSVAYANEDNVARRSSSCYSREIDEASPRFATFFDGPCKRPVVVSDSHSPTNMAMAVLSRKSSMYASFSNSSPASTASKATTLDADTEPSFYKSPRSSDTVPRSLSSSPPVTSSRATSLDSHSFRSSLR
jgi:hypothetical protein